MRRTNIYLDDEQTSALDERARSLGVSRAELIRQILRRELDTSAVQARRERLLRAIDESFGVLADVEFDPPQRGPDERSRYLDELWNREF
jgi:hypothetical protein